MRIAVTVPVFVKNEEHKKYLYLTTASIVSVDHDIIFIPIENNIDPSMRPIDYGFNFSYQPLSIHKVPGREPQCVAKAWNDGISKAQELKCDYVLVINSDIVIKSNAIDRLVAFATGQAEAVMWTMAEYSDLALLEEAPEDENFSEHPHFSAFMVKSNFVDETGGFDENFTPAYCEDGDMHARLALMNKKAYIYGGARFYHFGSRVIKSDTQEWNKNSLSFPKNQQYFLDKWGHPPVNDVERMREVYFKNPYNETDKPVTYWKNDKPT